jgi:hypothetical protein
MCRSKYVAAILMLFTCKINVCTVVLFFIVSQRHLCYCCTKRTLHHIKAEFIFMLRIKTPENIDKLK